MVSNYFPQGKMGASLLPQASGPTPRKRAGHHPTPALPSPAH